MRQKFRDKTLKHSTPFITSYFPTKSNFTVHKEDTYNYYNHSLRYIGDEMLEDENNLGERIISRCQILNSNETHYNECPHLVGSERAIQINNDFKFNHNVYDYDTYIADTKLRSNYEIGGRATKKRQKKIKNKMHRKKSRMKIKNKTMHHKKSRMKNHRKTQRY